MPTKSLIAYYAELDAEDQLLGKYYLIDRIVVRRGRKAKKLKPGISKAKLRRRQQAKMLSIIKRNQFHRS